MKNTIDQKQLATLSGQLGTVRPGVDLETWTGPPQAAGSQTGQFVDRRGNRSEDGGLERRQFTNSHEGLSPEAQEFALAVDHYKVTNRRRFISYDEILNVVKSLGYHKD